MGNRENPTEGAIFFDKFANQQATSVAAEGEDILSVTMTIQSDEALERAFTEIEKLTDKDLDIEN